MYFPLAQRTQAWLSRPARRRIQRAREEALKLLSREADLHPAHAAYVAAQHQLAAMVEELSDCPELAPLTNLLADAEDEYMPAGPPISPLTLSYFTCWSLFDACVGRARETFGSVLLALGGTLGLDPELSRTLRLLQESRMGLHLCHGIDDHDRVHLQEIGTGEQRRAIVPSGHRGRFGELWYARVLPPPVPGGQEHVVFTTPYLLLKPGLSEWRAYCCRTGETHAAYEDHLKYGPTRSYWNDFVMEGYVNHRSEAILLQGLPDVPASRPHYIVV